MSRVTERTILDRKLGRLSEVLPPQPPKGWVATIRNALGMTAKQLGKRLSISQSGVAELEKSENERSISLRTLDRAADALGCDVRYVLIPRSSLTQTVLRQAERFLNKEQQAVNRTMELEDQNSEEKIEKSDVRRSLEFAMTLLKNERRIWDIE